MSEKCLKFYLKNSDVEMSEKMYELLDFGKYNFYVWTSYLITFSAILIILFRTTFLYIKYKKLLKKLK